MITILSTFSSLISPVRPRNYFFPSQSIEPRLCSSKRVALTFIKQFTCPPELGSCGGNTHISLRWSSFMRHLAEKKLIFHFLCWRFSSHSDSLNFHCVQMNRYNSEARVNPHGKSILFSFFCARRLGVLDLRISHLNEGKTNILSKIEWRFPFRLEFFLSQNAHHFSNRFIPKRKNTSFLLLSLCFFCCCC